MAESKVQCPFYGASLVFLELVHEHPRVDMSPSPFLIVTPGNRCALITSAQSPCIREIHGRTVEWSQCRRNPEVNGSYRIEL